MQLRDYLHFQRKTLKKFAEELEFSVCHLSGYINGRLRLSKKAARAIERATGGKVTAAELIAANPSKKIYTKNKKLNNL